MEGGAPDRSKRVSATVTSPDKSMAIRYISPSTRDDAPTSVHVVKKADAAVGNAPLAIVGSYPVAYGRYQPSWTLMARGTANELTPGKLGLMQAIPSFDVEGRAANSLVASGPVFESAAQAGAWLDSADGKTALAVLASYGTK